MKQDESDLDDYWDDINRFSSFDWVEGSLILVWVIRNKWVIINHTINKKFYSCYQEKNH